MNDARNAAANGSYRPPSEVASLLQKMTIVDPAARIDFIGKLAKENRWSRDYAKEVYAEYLRFLLMAWYSPTMVVPSQDVDRAWHLHLTHTKHYWGVLCGTILGRPLHHEPGLETDADGRLHADLYAATLLLYRRMFQDQPPSSIWPSPGSDDRPLPDAKPSRTLKMVAAQTGVVTGAVVATLTGHAAIAMTVLLGGGILLYRTRAATPPGRKVAPMPKPRAVPGARPDTGRVYPAKTRSPGDGGNQAIVDDGSQIALLSCSAKGCDSDGSAASDGSSCGSSCSGGCGGGD
ncbi:glycine-rich domain-containing protein [Sphingomonas sp. 3-13AW]|uniref:glycine-rich domain-containing protein n=1 Tax=Sphingomonas sp. 3-13AW TaxID=3050450 RepID=UPI003BB7C5EA